MPNAVNYGICYVRQTVWFFVILCCAVTIWLLNCGITFKLCMPIWLSTYVRCCRAECSGQLVVSDHIHLL